MREYRYDLGFAIDGVPIPDPSGFNGSISDLDASGERDMTGLLHRAWVAEKIPTELRYTNIDWDMCGTILRVVKYRGQYLRFSFPNPADGTVRTGDYYVGDRKWDAVWLPGDKGHNEWFVSLTFSVIER